MKYAAIDLSKAGLVGFAGYEDGELLASGYLKESKAGWSLFHNPKDYSKPKPSAKGLSVIDVWDLLACSYEHFVLEDTFSGKSGAVAMKLAEARGFLMGILHGRVTFHKISIDDWRNTICAAHHLVAWPRDRVAGKELSISLARERHGFDPMNDDEADAINIGAAFHMQGRTR